ncbi:Vacuolar protein sorting-associated protein 35 [Cichlidogyrus casuarinus]|uniref:Vacuolar protein sorting-associated protein 35 n=1 Tax=Cichlidogyrus casuarinus TaxID=1844966 RepID=A0ABD2QD89_9PLAT
MLITVGIVNIKCNPSLKRELITDLTEMCRGVQHPLRGLFLRSYLLQCLDASILSDSLDDPYCSLEESVSFILTNFSEMNKLWVRMQHQGHSRNKQAREMERKDLRLLVGTNLTRIAQFESITVDFYKTKVLPVILGQIVASQDIIAQEYLMDIIVQVFPENFHIATFDQLMNTLTLLEPKVLVCPLLCNIINRLGSYELQSRKKNEASTIQLNTLNWPNIVCDDSEGKNLLEESLELLLNPRHNEAEPNIAISLAVEVAQLLLRTRREQVSAFGLTAIDVAIVYQTLINLSQHLLGQKCCSLINYFLSSSAVLISLLLHDGAVNDNFLANEILLLLNQPLDPNSLLSGDFSQLSRSPRNNSGFSKTLVSQKVPNEAICTIQQILEMEGFRKLSNLLDPLYLRRMAKHVIYSALEQNHYDQNSETSSRLSSEAVLKGLFGIIQILIKPADDLSYRSLANRVTKNESSEEILEELNALAGVIHLIGPEPRHKDVDLTFKLLKLAYDSLLPGGQAVIKICFPALIFETVVLLKAYRNLLKDKSYEEMSTEEKQEWDQKVYVTVDFCHKLISQLITFDSLETALRCYLDCTLAIDMVDFNKRDSLTYEFLSQAIYLCEERIRDAKAQPNALLSIIACLLDLRNLKADDHATLRLQCTRSANRLLRRSDQTKLVANCALMHWHSTPRENDAPFVLILEESKDKPECCQANGTEVVKCLDRARDLAQDCMDTNVRVQLFIDLLNINSRFRTDGCSEVTDERLQNLLDTVDTLMQNADLRDKQMCFNATYYDNTLAYLRNKKVAEKRIFSGLKIPIDMAQREAS